MENKLRDYVRNLSQLADLDVEDVGIEANLISSLRSEGIPITGGFVLTTKAFDDFLNANDFIDPISQLIHSTDYDDQASIAETARGIETLIMTGTFPVLIKNPVIKLYNFLSGETDSFVNIGSSSINGFMGEVASKEKLVVKGEEDLLEAIKYIWADLFSEQALLYRDQEDYEGFLTTAVIVQKSVNADISGEVYTVDTDKARENVIEIRPIWGLPFEEDEVVPDRYWYDIRIERIIDKVIVPQEYMYVRTDKSSDASFGEKLPISLKWRKKQKLEDNLVLKLAHQSIAIRQMFDDHLIVSWSYVAGVFFITDVRVLGDEELAKAKAVYIKQGIKTIQSSPQNKKNPKSNKESEKMIAAEVYHDPLGDVEASPIEELTQILTGRGNKQKLVFGFAAFVDSPKDWLNIGADKIIIVDKFQPDHIAQMNSARGIVFKSRLTAVSMSELIVPVIHDIDDISDFLKDGELVTVDPPRGAIYLGAGYRDSSESTVPDDLDFGQRYLDLYEPKEVKQPSIVQRRKSYIFDSPESGQATTPIDNNEELEARLASESFKSSLLASDEELGQEEKPEEVEEKQSRNRSQSNPSTEEKKILDTNINFVEPEIVGVRSTTKPKIIDADIDVSSLLSESSIREDEGIDLSFMDKVREVNDETEEFEEDDSDEEGEINKLSKPSRSKHSVLAAEISVDEDTDVVKTSSDFWQIFDPSNPFIESANVQGIIIEFEDIYDLLEVSPYAVLRDRKSVSSFISNLSKYIASVTETICSKYIIMKASNYNRLDDVSVAPDQGGAEAILGDSLLFEMELRIIKRLRNRERLRNIWFAIPDVRKVSEVNKIKKLINEAGLRRSSTFKVLISVSAPLALISIQDFVDTQIDGVIFNLDEISYEFDNSISKSLDPNITKLLGFVIETVSQSKTKSYLLNRDVKIFKEELDAFLGNGLANFCLEEKDLLITKKVVAKLEVRQLKRKKKRGRKKKKITYGF